MSDQEEFTKTKGIRWNPKKLLEMLDGENRSLRQHIKMLEDHLFNVHYCNCERIEEESK